MYKLIVLDIDGTLRDEKYGIPISTKHALELCNQKGYQICICTGRNLSSIQDDVLQLPVHYWITGGGHFITSPTKVISEYHFDQQDINHVYGYLQDHKEIGVVFEGKTEMFMNQKAVDYLMKMNHEKEISHLDNKIDYQDQFHLYNQEPIHKICLWCKDIDYKKIQDIMENRYLIAQNTDHYYELVCLNGDKGIAIQKLIQYLKIYKDEVIAFGDGLNDLSLFENVGCSVAMGNASEKLKSYASYVCEDIMDEGIYKELKRQKII